MKYPIDALSTETFFGHLIANDRAQRKMIQALTLIVQTAMEDVPSDTDWSVEAQKLFRLQKTIDTEHQTRIFNAKNGHPENSTIKIEGIAETGNIDKMNETVYVPGVEITPQGSAMLSQHEADEFGGEMSEEELAAHFREKPKRQSHNRGVDLSKKQPFKGMTLEDIEDWEAKQDNSNDLFKIKARVQNNVAATGGSLTDYGTMMVNSFVHVAKDLYDFAENIQDRELRIKLIERIRKHETMPATLIQALASGVNFKSVPK